MRRKGERTRSTIERDFPEVVEIEVPGSGLRGRLDKIERWCTERLGVWGYGKTGRMAGLQQWARWHFKDRADADTFQKEFGGTRLTIEPKRKR
jgi:hypothetical protein